MFLYQHRQSTLFLKDLWENPFGLETGSMIVWIIFSEIDFWELREYQQEYKVSPHHNQELMRYESSQR